MLEYCRSEVDNGRLVAADMDECGMCLITILNAGSVFTCPRMFSIFCEVHNAVGWAHLLVIFCCLMGLCVGTVIICTKQPLANKCVNGAGHLKSHDIFLRQLI